MFRSRKEKLFLISFIAAVVLIPTSTFLLSQRIKVSENSPLKIFDRKITSLPSSSPKQSALNDLKNSLGNLPNANAPATGSDANLPSYGPGLSFKITIEGRPTTDYSTKLFVGIASGELSTNPQYLLSYNVDVPADGTYSGISLTGLTQGSTYTAYLKGTSTIVASSTFAMNPTGVTLNNGSAINLIAGDLNEDNVIDQADYDLAKSALGATPGSSKWNANFDLNSDGIINNLDLGIIQRNFGKIGDSGKWYSQVSTSSTNLITPPKVGGATGGRWLWVPSF